MGNYVLNDEKMFSDIADGIAVVINSETGIYYGMNAFGTMVFEHIVGGASVQNILDAAQKLEGLPSDFSQRLDTFIAIMLEKGILKQGTDSAHEVVLDLAVATEDLFALEITEYDDAQELLLADPIHEVKEGTGWAPEKTALETDQEVVKNKEAKMEE